MRIAQLQAEVAALDELIDPLPVREAVARHLQGSVLVSKACATCSERLGLGALSGRTYSLSLSFSLFLSFFLSFSLSRYLYLSRYLCVVCTCVSALRLQAEQLQQHRVRPELGEEHSSALVLANVIARRAKVLYVRIESA
jgi:hypothetical protein